MRRIEPLRWRSSAATSRWNAGGLFDRFVDGLNRLPRPALALGTLGLFIGAMVDPIWFAARMQGIAPVPEPLCWLLEAIVSFYFGARHQAKGQEFQRSIPMTLARAGDVTANLSTLQALQTGAAPMQAKDNAALADWRTGGLAMPDSVVGPSTEHGPRVLLVVHLLYRDDQKDQATRDLLNKNTSVLTELAVLIRERLPRS